jgi:hypothetical protein
MKRKGGVDELRPAEAKLSEEARDGHGQRCPIFFPGYGGIFGDRGGGLSASLTTEGGDPSQSRLGVGRGFPGDAKRAEQPGERASRYQSGLPLDIVASGSSEGATVGVADKLRNAAKYVRKRWRATDPDSYHQYRRGRERTRKQAEHRREDAERHGEQEREEAAKGREYEERYRAERAAEEPRTKAPPDTAATAEDEPHSD